VRGSDTIYLRRVSRERFWHDLSAKGFTWEVLTRYFENVANLFAYYYIYVVATLLFYWFWNIYIDINISSFWNMNISPPFIKHDVSSTYWKEPFTRLHPEPAVSNPQLVTFLRFLLILFYHLRLGPTNFLSLSGVSTTYLLVYIFIDLLVFTCLFI
jgi:hypothetical protein